ncbi:hypothetical protein ACHAXT_009921 [Thalassiosira profunda]
MSVDAEILLDRLLSASTPTDCLDSLERLQSLCKRQRPKQDGGGGDPKSKRPSQQAELEAALKEAAAAEEERQRQAVDALLGNKSVLRALCSLVASSTLPSQHSDGNGMEVEGGDVAACELLLEALPTQPSNAATKKKEKATTEALQKEKQRKRRLEFISKTLLHFHEDDGDKDGPLEGGDTSSLALTPSLLDCLCASPSSGSTSPAPSVYARVLSLQLLQSLLSASPGTLREQLMRAPDGINRLVDLLGYSSMATGEEPDVPEEVRNQAILFLTSLASSSSVLARLITFSEGYDRSLKIALEGIGDGMPSSGSTVAMDCLGLCMALARADDVARELFLGGGDGRGNLDRLARLVDLRGGERFRDKERNLWWDRELKERRTKAKGESVGKNEVAAAREEGKQPKEEGRKGRRGKRKEEDDLDDILRGASASTAAPPTKKAEAEKQPDQPQQPQPMEPEGPPTPYLTPDEEMIVDAVFDLLLTLLLDGEEEAASPTAARSITEASKSKRRGRAKTVLSHDLARYLVDCALYTLPPIGVDFVSAVPPAKMQLKALEAVAVLGSLGETVISQEESGKGDEKEEAKKKKDAEDVSQLQTKLLFETMPIYLHGRVTAIDRLMFLCCTGAYIPGPSTGDESESPEAVASLLSTYSVSAFRSCLPTEMATRLVLHALAPPPPEEADESGAPLEPPVVTRLVMTLADNLHFLQQQQQSEASSADICRAAIGAAGSAGALSVFLAGGEGDATREMLLRLPPPPPPPQLDGSDAIIDQRTKTSSLIDFFLQHIATYDPETLPANEELRASLAYVTTTLLTLLCDWVTGMPRAVSEVLSSHSSVSVGVLLRSKKSSGSGAGEAVPALSGLLLGLCLEYMADPAGVPPLESSAWTRETIVDMIQSMGVSKYLNMLDEWKGHPMPLPFCDGKERSSLERRDFAGWYWRNVTLIRRRVVVALAGSRGDVDSDDEGDAADGKSSSSLKSLRKMVTTQMAENEGLQAKLDEALSTIASQSIQIKELKRVTELGASAETSDMIDEYTETVAELEKAKAEVAREAERQQKLHEEALAAKEKMIEAFRKDLGQSQARVEEMTRDNETLAEEMSGLSAAYNSLEEQFNRSNGGGSSSGGHSTEMTAGGGTSEDERPRDQPRSSSGEAAAEDPGRSATNSHEVQSLREENARLREDVRAANEWMAMAVSKMDELGGQNESLTHSLEEAHRAQAALGPSDASDSAMQGELDALREEAQRARAEGEAARLTWESAMKSKDEELSGQMALVKQLEGQVEELKQSTEAASEEPSGETEESSQVSASQMEELDSLRQSNKDAQEWMANAVTHVDTLTKQVQEKDEQLEQMATKLQAQESSSTDEADAKVAGLEASLKDITSERDELQASFERTKDELTQLQESNEELRQAAVSDVNDSPVEALQQELEQMKAENVTLTSNLSEFQSWSATAQGRMAEMEAQLQQATSERDKLNGQLEENAAGEEVDTTEPQSSSIESEAKVAEAEAKVAELERSLADVTSERDGLQNDLAKMKEEKESDGLDKTPGDAQVSDSSTEALQHELDQVKAENATLSTSLSEFQSWSETAQSRMAEVEAKLQETTAERDELKARQEETAADDNTANSPDAGQIASLEQEIRDKNEQLEKMQEQLFEDAEEHNADNEKLLIDLEAERKRIAEVEAKLQETTAERDELKAQQELSAADENASSPPDANQIASLQQEIREKTEQLEKMQEQLFEDAEEHEADNEKLLNDLLAERKRIEDLTQKEQEATTKIDELSREKELLSITLAEKEFAMESLTTGKHEADTRAEEANRRISELEAAKSVAESQVDKLMALEGVGDEDVNEKVAVAVAERNEVQSQLDDIKEVYEEARKSLESIAVENGDLSKRIAEADVRMQEKDNLLAMAADEKATLESALEEMKSFNDQTATQWQERTNSLETEIETWAAHLEKQQQEASEAVAQWEAKCASLEGSREEVTKQWQERVDALQADVESLKSQLEMQEKEAAEAVEQWKARCDDLEKSDEDVLHKWEERAQTLEGKVASLENQLEQQEMEAAEAIAAWEARCATLEDSGGAVIAEWEARVKALEAEVATIEGQVVEKENEAANAIEQWQERCSALEESEEGVVQQWQERAQSLEEEVASLQDQLEQKEKEAHSQLESLNKEIEDRAQTIESMRLQLSEKDEEIASSDDQVAELAKELVDSQKQSETVVQQWQERSEELETNIAELEETIQEQEKGANDAIAEWEARCATLHEKIEFLELEVAASEQDTAVIELKAQVAALTAKLEAVMAENEKTCEHLKEAKESLSKQVAALEAEHAGLQQEKRNALKESEESQVIVLELQEELRHSKEELQSFATDQFGAKATEMATEALRQQMAEIRSQYVVDNDALASEREARQASEDEVQRLKSDLALLAQATEYNDEVDVYVRTMAKKVSAANVKIERKEMEELRSTIERLREELGSCRWKERESEEKAANVRLQMSILEQEANAAKTDLALLETALEELENSKIELSVSLEYRVEALENERALAEQAYEEEINGIKAELAQVNQDRDGFAHKLEQSEKANAALVYSTAQDALGGAENESEVIKLQLERAQLLAKINEMGTDLERRVREAVATQASSAEAELIIEKQARVSLESSLAEARSELKETKMQKAEHDLTSRSDELADKDEALQDLEESLDEMRIANEELEQENTALKAKLDASEKDGKSTIDSLTSKLQKAEEQLRSEDRESRFEVAIAAEIAHLRSSQATTNGNGNGNHHALVLRGIDENMRPGAFFEESKESIERNSAYIIEMYDYVVELKHSISEERQMYKDLLAEHEDLLALLGQAGLADGVQFSD